MAHQDALPLYINGRTVAATSGDTFTVTNPYDGSLLATVGQASQGDQGGTELHDGCFQEKAVRQGSASPTLERVGWRAQWGESRALRPAVDQTLRRRATKPTAARPAISIA